MADENNVVSTTSEISTEQTVDESGNAVTVTTEVITETIVVTEGAEGQAAGTEETVTTSTEEVVIKVGGGDNSTPAAEPEPETPAPEPETPTPEPETPAPEAEKTPEPEPVASEDVKVEVPVEPEVSKDPEPEPQEEPKKEEPAVVAPKANGIACTLADAEDYFTTKRDGSYKIQFSGREGHITNRPAISVEEFMDQAVKSYGTRVAMKVERDGKWISWTYKEYFEEIKTAAKGFIKLGLEPYNGVGIIGFNSPEWLFSDLGAIYAGGLATGVYTTNNPEACQYVCSDANCNIVVVENDVQLQKILQVWDQLPALKAVVQYLGEVSEKRDNIYSWNEFMEIGRKENEDELNKRINMQSPNKCCSLIYTSGTTGNPKGVMMSHDNIIIATEGVIEQLHPAINVNSNVQETCISYLPLSHIAAQMTDVWIPIRAGAVVWFAKPDALKGSLSTTLQQARPTLFVGVPRVYEKIEEKIKGIGANVKGVKRKLADWAKGVSLTANTNKERGASTPFGYSVASMFLKKVSKALGLDRAKFIWTAAAPISKSTLQYFQSINLPLNEIYGMSETAGALTMGVPGKCRITSIGTIMPEAEYKIANPDEDGSGELCFRGRMNFMGYLNNLEKVKETIDEENWLHTGDVGKIDKDGFFYITGRIKELIITAGGENIAPVPIEDEIKTELPFIGTAMVIGDKKKFLSCLLTCQVEIDLDTGLAKDNLQASAVHYLKSIGVEATKAEDLTTDMPEVLKTAIQTGINNANKKAVSNAARVQKWKLLPTEFTTAGGELGPTQKLRRPHVMKMYKETIDAFYSG